MGLDRLRVRNYRALADVDLELRPINVVFGPNGAGKSTLLDAIYFFHDCVVRDAEVASSERGQGIGMLWDGGDPRSRIMVELSGVGLAYELSFALAAGIIEPRPGERLVSAKRDVALIERPPGSKTTHLFDKTTNQATPTPLREPEKASLGVFSDLSRDLDLTFQVWRFDHLMRSVRLYHSRSFDLDTLKRRGSESSHQVRLSGDGGNAWSVLRNVHDKRDVDARYNTIIGYMKEAFPAFQGIVPDQTGPGSVYASFIEKHRNKAILASGMSDGWLQLLLLLVALFADERESVLWDSVLLFDEPETSLHPWAIAVLARAMTCAATQWGKQVFVATHSPVLISQFEAQDVLAAQVGEGRVTFKRLSEMAEISDLLDEYAAGALYMSEAVARQSAQSGDIEGQ